MNEEQRDEPEPQLPDIYETPTFSKALKKLHNPVLMQVEDAIDDIAKNPGIGESKKGDLSHMRVHKVKIQAQFILIGYSVTESKIILLSLGPHENFYADAKQRRKSDLKHIHDEN